MSNHRKRSPRYGTTIDAVFKTFLLRFCSRVFIPYFSYHKPIVSFLEHNNENEVIISEVEDNNINATEESNENDNNKKNCSCFLN